jgi:hypothetical protein
MSRRFPATLLAAALLGLSGCGSSDPEPSEGGGPAITVGGIPYEDGGGDGSGADGTEEPNPRGGIAAGPDTPSPTDQPDGDIQSKQPAESE